MAATLNGRIPEQEVKAQFSVAGALGIAVGIALLSGASGTSNVSLSLFAGAIGIILIALGVVPLLSRLFQLGGDARVGSSVSPNLRLVLRSLSRHAARSAAATLGIGAVVAAIWLAAVDDFEERSRASTAMIDDSFAAAELPEPPEELAVEVFDRATSVIISSPNVEVREQLSDQALEATGMEESVTLFAYETSNFGSVFTTSTEQSLENDRFPSFPSFVGGRAFLEGGPLATWERVPVSDLVVITDVDDFGSLGDLRNHRAVITPSDTEFPIVITPVRVLLLAGIVLGALVMAFVMYIVSGEVAPELRTLSLLGTSSRFRQRFFATQAFLLSATGVGTGLAVGTVLRFVVDVGLPIPMRVLLTLLALPPVFGIGTYILSWRPRRSVPARSDMSLAV